MFGTTLHSSAEQVSLLQLIRRLWVTDERSVELWEPLWIRKFPVWLMFACVIRMRSTTGRSGYRGHVVFYAIENSRLDQLLTVRGRNGGRLVQAVLRRVLRELISRLTERIAFGSAGAAATYASIVDPRRVTTRTIHQLPTAAASSPPAERRGIVFVGALEERKGVHTLLAAWRQLECRLPTETLSVIGAGPLAGEVEVWARQRPETRRFLGHLERTQVLEVLNRSAVLAAPSLPDGRWREQIGLPIVEALAHGLTVVTTDQTGIAAYLAAHGHAVVPSEAVEHELPSALERAIRSPIDARAVRANLPPIDGRTAADEWLHQS